MDKSTVFVDVVAVAVNRQFFVVVDVVNVVVTSSSL
jgi:hypothetical protein